MFCGAIGDNHFECIIKSKASKSCGIASNSRVEVPGAPSLTYRFRGIGRGYQGRHAVMEKQYLSLGAYIDWVRRAGWVT
jgi:hypothetical protein